MAKDITIQEGGVARNFTGVEKLTTNVIGGSTQNWVPEDEAENYVETGHLRVDENGHYNASDDGYIGYGEVDVNVANAANLTDKHITSNGTYSASEDGADGYSSVDVDVPQTETEPEAGDTGAGVDQRGEYRYGIIKIKIYNNKFQKGLRIVPTFTIRNNSEG